MRGEIQTLLPGQLKTELKRSFDAMSRGVAFLRFGIVLGRSIGVVLGIGLVSGIVVVFDLMGLLCLV